MFEFEKESLRMAFESIAHRKIRSALSSLGIVIGIAAVVALVSIGEGTNAAVNEALGSLGANTIFVTSGGGGGFGPPSDTQSLVKDDLRDIQSVRGVETAVGLLIKTLPVTFRSETQRMSFYGVDSKDAQNFFTGLRVVDIDEGRFFKSGEKNSIVIGHQVSQNTFEDTVSVNDKLEIGDEKFQVVGITKETGTSQYDSLIIAPLESIMDSVTDKDKYTLIFARAENPDRIEETAKAIQDEMDDAHGEKTFIALTSKQLTEQIGTVTNVLSLVLGGIAGIALIVAGIGIANTMYMSIMERTKEIGIMKAIGATNRNVLEIFIMEAGMIGLIGGLLGDALGIVLSNVMGIVIKNYGMAFSTKVTPELLALGLGFSVSVGIIFGLLPATKAAKLQPVDALRYE